MQLPVVIVLVGLLPFGPLPPRLLQPHRASLPAVLRAESRSGLLHSESIRAYAPSLVPKLEGLQDQDLDTIDELQRELQPSVDYLLQSAPAAASTLRLGLEVAYIAHLGQRRRSGEPYIIHPVKVACILGQSQMDLVSVVSGLLHDTVEDTVLTLAELDALFGVETRRIVEGETKVSKLPKMVRSQPGSQEAALRDLSTKEGGKGGKEGQAEPRPPTKSDIQAENQRSMIVAMAKDWRIVVIKLADRLHNMRTLQFMPVHKRVAIARETLEIFVPLAHRLGLRQYKTELADLSFKTLFPAEFAEIEAHIDTKLRRYEETLAAAISELEARLQADPMLQHPDGSGRSLVRVTGRTKSIHSTWKKLQRDGGSIEELLDLIALRVVLLTPETKDAPADAAAACTDGVSLCYHTLGRVHGIWTPLPRTLKDYISSPKPNGYRSLHTTVLVGMQPLEVQIRTHAMHLVAEYGCAAHWAYSEDVTPSDAADPADARDAWLQVSSSAFSRSIARWEEDVECSHQFMELVRRQLLGTRVFVYSELRGGTRILNLARGATLADAAELVEASLGEHICLLSGVEVPPSRELQNGDVLTFVPSSPAEAWEQAADGRRRVGRRRKAAGEGAGSGAGEGGAAADGLGYDGGAQLGDAWRNETLWRPCEHCLPLYGDKVVGCYAPSGSGRLTGTVHRLEVDSGRPSQIAGDCLELRRQLASGQTLLRGGGLVMEDELSAALPPTERSDVFGTKVIVFTRDRPGILVELSSVISLEVVNIIDVRSKTRDIGGASAFQYHVQVSSLAMIERLFDAVAALDDVVHVRRGDMLHMLHDSPDGFWAHAAERPAADEEQP